MNAGGAQIVLRTRAETLVRIDADVVADDELIADLEAGGEARRDDHVGAAPDVEQVAGARPGAVDRDGGAHQQADVRHYADDVERVIEPGRRGDESD